MNKLHPNAKWLFRFGFFFTVFLSLFILGFILYLYRTSNDGPFFLNILSFLLSLKNFLIILATTIVFAEIFARLQYKNWAYEFTEHELKKERGIISKRYSSVPYERIQNVEIHRGILARMFGFSSLSIHTAGFSGVSAAEGSIPALGVEEAEKIRAFLMKEMSIKSNSKQGL